MGTVYILKSLVNGKYYVGSTNNLDRRLSEHAKGKTKSLRSKGPFDLVFRQEFSSLKEARTIEYKLKKLKSRLILDRVIKDQIVRLGP